MTDANYLFFKSHIDELITRYDGRFIVIKDESIIADYSTFDEAYNNTIKTEELGTFLIQQCVNLEDDAARFAWHNVSFSQVVQI